MDFGENPSSRYNAKLHNVKGGVNSQILDYYKRFGQNRDLEQYFFSHGSGTNSNITTDRTEFATARCLIQNDDHSQCQKKANALKELVSKSVTGEKKYPEDTSFKSLNLKPFPIKVNPLSNLLYFIYYISIFQANSKSVLYPRS